MAAPQPDFVKIVAAMQSIADGLNTVMYENQNLLLPVDIHGQLLIITESLQRLAVNLANHATLASNQNATATLNSISMFLANAPMRAFNAMAPECARIHGPVGYGLLPPPITTRRQLDDATIDQLDTLNSGILLTEGYPETGTVDEKRRAIVDYLGLKA